MSSGGTLEKHRADASAETSAPIVPGLPEDFRATWPRVADRIASEHERLVADVYEGDAGIAEDLFWGDAGVGVYLIAREEDGGARFAVGDARGRVVQGNLEPCARCHRDAPNALYPIKR